MTRYQCKTIYLGRISQRLEGRECELEYLITIGMDSKYKLPKNITHRADRTSKKTPAL
jgi:hypothetical protein